MKKKRTLRLLMSIAILFAASFVAFAQQQTERIIRFHSDIKIETDGRIEVAEHIKVYAGGNEIKRGIVRELPLYRENDKRKKVKMDYSILLVQCNGGDTKYRTERSSDKLEVYIGDANVQLSAGEYDYTIVYESYGHIGFFDDFDELYWNVTGTEWIFPIEQASAAITLPGVAKAIQTDFYTGVKGAKGKDCRVEDRGNIQVFKSTRRLARGEGLTAAVGFTRDIITRPPPPSKAVVFWNKHTYGICGLAGAVICLLYFLISMLMAGKPHIKPVAIPLFTPPRNLSPASIRYLTKKKYDNKSFTATLVEMAVKSAMSILCDEKKTYSLVNKINTERLRPEEQQMHTTIFAGTETKSTALLQQLMKSAENNPALRESLNFEELQKGLSETEVKVSQTNHIKFSKAGADLKEAMEKQWNLNDYFRENNLRIATGGVILNLIFVLYMILTGGTAEVCRALVLASPLIVWEVIYLFTPTRKIMKSGFFNSCMSCLGFTTAFIVVGTMLGMALMESDNLAIHLPSAGFFAAMSLAYVYYAKRLKMFTADGATLSAEIDGFKMYMKTAEEHRLNMLTPPERTPELFEKFLPYSIALDVSNEWCKKFDDVLKRFHYQPEWYGGAEDISVTDFATTFSALSTSFGRSISNAQRDPSSDSSGSSDWSSGSDGGGYSGGGGGGGGGRGW